MEAAEKEDPYAFHRCFGYGYVMFTTPKLVVRQGQHIEAKRDPTTGMLCEWKVVDDMPGSDDGWEGAG